MHKSKRKTKIFLGAYINKQNAQNLNCLALAKYLDKEKYEIYALTLYSGNRQKIKIDGVKTLYCFYPQTLSKFLGFAWGIFQCDIAYLPKGEVWEWNKFWLWLLRKKSFSTVESIIDDIVLDGAIKYYGSKKQFLAHYNSFSNLYSITEYMSQYNKTHWGIQTKKKILYLGTEIETFLSESKKIEQLQEVIFIGNDMVRKGIYEYIELSRRFPNLIFHVVGSGNEKIDLSNEITKRGISNIKYHGILHHSELKKLLKHVDLNILPSRSEGFPKVILETAAAGVPSLLYRDYGADEWIADGNNGFLVENTEEMAQILNHLQEQHELLKSVSVNAIELAKKFDWRIMIKEWETVLDGIK